MAEKDAKIRNLQHIIEEKEREIEMLRENIHNINSGASLEVVQRLEGKVTELEGLVKGLTEELLDIKAVVRNIESGQENRTARIPVDKSGRGGKKDYPPIKTERRHRPAEKVSASGNEVEEDDTVLIMQPDGTLKREKRINADDVIIAGNRPRHNSGSFSGDRGPRGGQKTRNQDGKPLIYAEEDDTVEIKKNR